MNDSLCNIIGCDVVGTNNYLFNIGSIIRGGFSLIFAGIIVYGIFIIIKAVYQIIGSNGDEGKVESGIKTIKGVYIGIIMIFVGLFGLVLLFTLFNVTELPTNVDIPSGPEGPIFNNPF